MYMIDVHQCEIKQGFYTEGEMVFTYPDHYSKPILMRVVKSNGATFGGKLVELTRFQKLVLRWIGFRVDPQDPKD